MKYYYLEKVERYIDQLRLQSFDGWTKDEIKGYLTTCESIKQKVKSTLNEAHLDAMDED